jgi:hypothetical protein
MGLTRDFKETVQDRINRDPEFCEELLKELGMDFNYKMTVDLDMAHMYAKEKCKICHGKGYQIVTYASSGRGLIKGCHTQENYSYCKCAEKEMKKKSKKAIKKNG